jgi:SAM-dependent methyltransferase
MHTLVNWVRTLALSVALALIGAAPVFAQPGGLAPDQTFTPEIGMAGKDVIWMPTVDTLLKAMLDAAAVKPGELVIDLGSGDGRIPIAAARDYGARARGIEYNPDLVKLSIENAKKAGVADKVEFIEGDIFKIDWSMADVLTLYLLPELNLQIREDILKMRPGTRVVSNSFAMGDWRPDQTLTVDRRTAYYWVVPGNFSGHWRANPVSGRPFSITVTQQHQKVTAIEGRRGFTRLPALDPVVSGPELSFTLVDGAVRSKVTLRLDGERASGSIASQNGAPVAVEARRAMRKQR